jgi:VanZ family protein
MNPLFLSLPALIIATVLFFVDTGSDGASLVRQLSGFGHLLYFGLLAWWLSRLPSVTSNPWPLQIGLIMAAVLVLGGAIELIQPFFGRNRSVADLGINLLGGLLGLFFLAPCRRLLPRVLLASGRLAGLAMTVIIFSEPAAALWDMQRAAREFPVLADFENRLEVGRWSNGSRDDTLARHGRASLRVELGRRKYAGTALRRGLGNWQGYSTFAFSLYNPGPEPLTLTISIRDREHERAGGRYHDRFNRSLRVEPGWNDLLIPVAEIEHGPAARTMDLAALSEVIFFAGELPEPRLIHLDHLRLLP